MPVHLWIDSIDSDRLPMMAEVAINVVKLMVLPVDSILQMKRENLVSISTCKSLISLTHNRDESTANFGAVIESFTPLNCRRRHDFSKAHKNVAFEWI